MTNEIQFPLKNIYNHDPIYGVSDGSSATTDVFREFLFDNAMRGTAFWELYYSPSIMDDAKWQVTADALDFAESNHEVLKNAKLFTTEGTSVLLRMCMATPHGTMSRASSPSSIRPRPNRPLR